MPEECHHPDSPLTSGAADAPKSENYRADQLKPVTLRVRTFLTVWVNCIIPIKVCSTATRIGNNSASTRTRLQDG
jgi:hypothetical protein